MFKRLLLFIFLSGQILAATTIAIFDNQINIDHPLLNNHIFKNLNEIENSVDDDQNGYLNDILGWNFQTNTSHQFQTHKKQSFPKEVFEYYELKAKKSLGTLTSSEEAVLRAISKDKEIMQKKKLFTKYAHGTHIACLAMGVNQTSVVKELGNIKINILPITYLTDESDTGSHPDFNLKKFKPLNSTNQNQQEKLQNVESYLKLYRNWLINKFNTSISYSKQFSKIINASWGQSFKSTMEFVEKIYFQEFKTQISNELLQSLTSNFMNELLIDGRQLLSSHNDVLFIFSAGNTKSDNDQNPHYPSSIKLENTISVGALHDDKKASFSNYGLVNVDFFYPGVAISSCTPDGEFLQINGTSQAAAQVSYIAALTMQLLSQKGIKASPAMIKEILTKTSIASAELKDLCFYGAKISLKNVINFLK